MNDKKRVNILTTRTKALGGGLYAPSIFFKEPIETLVDICNGCGAAGAKFDFVPDKIYGTSIGKACIIHDYMYYIGTTVEDKEEADRVFLNNMIRLIEEDSHKWYKPTALQRRRALKYYEAVTYFGGAAFWAGKPTV